MNCIVCSKAIESRPNRLYCEPCRAFSRRISNMAVRDRYIAAGTCMDCGGGPLATKKRCRPCADTRNAWYRDHRLLHGRSS